MNRRLQGLEIARATLLIIALIGIIIALMLTTISTERINALLANDSDAVKAIGYVLMGINVGWMFSLNFFRLWEIFLEWKVFVFLRGAYIYNLVHGYSLYIILTGIISFIFCLLIDYIEYSYWLFNLLIIIYVIQAIVGIIRRRLI